MNRYLIVIDMQNDFIDGALGTKEAQGIVECVVKETEGFDGTVIFTRDTHHADYMDTQEGKNLPILHCIEGETGWEICKPLEIFRQSKNCRTYNKPSFGSIELAHDMLKEHMKNPIDEICLIGLCTDICVISNALLLKAFLPEVKISVRKNCCAGVTPESHEAALCSMSSCQIALI
ncbi:isochorismatase family cysteine hydrolase [Lachnospiraceae bacterium 62-35]